VAREGSHKERRVPGMLEFMEGMQCWCGLQNENDMRNVFLRRKETAISIRASRHESRRRKHVKSEIAQRQLSSVRLGSL